MKDTLQALMSRMGSSPAVLVEREHSAVDADEDSLTLEELEHIIGGAIRPGFAVLDYWGSIS